MDSNNPKILAPTPSQWRQHSWDFESNLNLRTFPTRRNATTATHGISHAHSTLDPAGAREEERDSDGHLGLLALHQNKTREGGTASLRNVGPSPQRNPPWGSCLFKSPLTNRTDQPAARKADAGSFSSCAHSFSKGPERPFRMCERH